MNKQPKKWKMAVLVWLAIYPTITVLTALFEHHLASIHPMPLRTLVMSLITVPLLVYSIIPALQRLLQKWMSQ